MDSEIKEYYKLKEKYERSIRRQKDNIQKNDVYTLNQKKKRYKLIENKCINCKQIGGTIFSNNNRILRAVCGNKETPCNLNISINRKDYKYVNSIDESKRLYDDIGNLKNEIIKIKLNLLFEYINEDEMIKKFNTIKNALSKLIIKYEKINNFVLEQTENLENMDKIIELETSISMLINRIKDIGNTLVDGEDNNKEIIEIYINELEPLLKELFEKKYRDAYINKCILIQEKFNVRTLEYNILEK